MLLYVQSLLRFRFLLEFTYPKYVFIDQKIFYYT